MIILVALGCAPVCRGPQCAYAWPAGALAVLPPEATGTVDAATLSTLLGAGEDGSSWVVASSSSGLYVGLPDRGRVIRVAPPQGVEALKANTNLIISGPPFEDFGASIALADTDGDGVEELWVGAPRADSGAGALYRYPTPDADTWDLRVHSATPADGLGEVLRGCADVTGDGLRDILVSAPRFAAPAHWNGPTSVPSLGGGVFLLRSEQLHNMGEFPWDFGPSWWGDQVGISAGSALACRDDLTSDGIADVAIGAPLAADEEGRVFVLSVTDGLTSGPLPTVGGRTLAPTEAAVWYGASIASTDSGLFIGAPGTDRGRGSVFIDRHPILRGPRDEADHYGQFLAVGNRTPAGYDLLVGAPDWRVFRGENRGNIDYDAGRAWLYHHHLDSAATVITGSRPFMRVGRGMLFADLNSDGTEEVVLPLRAADP